MRLLILSVVLLIGALAQTPVKPESEALRATRHAFMLVSTHAVAVFQSADTIAARLNADGSTLHPSTTTLRLRIEHVLDRAQTAIDKGDLEDADKEIKLADELVTRFSRRFGGE